jgi:4-carboxymuconolactone decarboxylase
MNDQTLNPMYERGLKMRKQVVGKDYVEKSIAAVDDLTRPLQELVTEYCWGAVWGREGLSLSTRSLLNVVMLTALNRPHELRLHLLGAIRNGCSKVEIREAMLQAGIYAGIPAAVDAFRVAKEVFAEVDAGGIKP